MFDTAENISIFAPALQKYGVVVEHVLIIRFRNMKRVLKRLSLISVVFLGVLGFAACEKDNGASGVVSLEGKWLTMSDEWTEFLFINEDHTFTSTGTDGEDMWNGVKGRILIDGNEFSLLSEDGDNSYGTFTLVDNKLTLTIEEVSFVYTKLIEDISIAGKWNCIKTESFIKAIKDEIELPVGSVVNGEVIPTTLPTEKIKGEFIENAIKSYFRNIEFSNDGKLIYSVLKEGEEMTMKKDYTLDNNLMTISGKVGNIEIRNSFMTFQKADKSIVYLFLTKQNVADMFVGYAMMLREGGVSEGSAEALEGFRNAFMETFENYAVIISLESR